MPLPIASFTRLEGENGAIVVVRKAVRKMRRGESGKEEAKEMGWLATGTYSLFTGSPQGPLLIYTISRWIDSRNKQGFILGFFTDNHIISLGLYARRVTAWPTIRIFRVVFGSTY
jgi:hypothetical protein